MKLDTSFILTFSLLILITSCSKAPSSKGEKEVTLTDASKLLNVVHESERPYVVVNFYATYCKPCIKEIPGLVAMKNDPKAEADVLFVSLDDEAVIHSGLASFLSKYEMNFRSFYMEPDGIDDFIKRFHPKWNSSIPLNLVFTKSGRLVEVTGMTERKEIEMIVHQDQRFFNSEVNP